jgi:hypothetical protein
MASDGRKKAYLRGYEAGLRAAWDEFIRMTTKGNNISELRLIAKSWITGIETRVAAAGEAYVEEREEEAPPADLSEVRLSAGESCLFREAAPGGSLNVFAALVQDGKGICVMRRHPDTVRDRLPLGELALLWLTRSEAEEAGVAHVSPTNLVQLTSTVMRLMEGDVRPVVYLDAVEYLTSQNGFDQVLRLIQKLNEEVVLRRGNLLVSLNPEAMRERQVQLIARELGREA